MSKKVPELPTKEELLSYIKSSSVPFSKRDLAKAFGIKGDLRVPFKKLIRDLLESEGVQKTTKKTIVPRIEVQKTVSKPVEFKQKPFVANKKIIAIFQGDFPSPYAIPIDKREGVGITLDLNSYTPKPKDMIMVELMESQVSLLQGKVVKVFEETKAADNFAMMTILTRDIPHEFSKEAIDLAKKAQPVTLGKREDLRSFPFVTIDGEDAKDFDDAVYAAPDENADNPDGWHMMVAIADVAHYVTPLSALDKAAYERGNSVYFPGTVVPMLPEELSNDLCSLRPNVDRAAVVAHMWIDKSGKLIKYKFSRCLIKSVARLTYHEVEFALDQKEHALEYIVSPLHTVFKILRKAREKRGALDINSRENKILFNAKGEGVEILPREQLVSHHIIEEFMILANVAAARFLEDKKLPCMYRIHAKPDPVKVQALRDFLIPLKLITPQTQLKSPSDFNALLTRTENSPFSQLVNEMVLRTQSQAVYSPSNIGHFGLSLEKYAHFTSPIRRYSDLVVHRSILTALKQEDGQSENLLTPTGAKILEDTGMHISGTERRAAEAEREVIAKYIAQIMHTHLGEVFEARITSVQSFGFFVTALPYYVDGLVHIRTLDPRDFFVHDPKRHLLRGERSKTVYALGDKVKVKLIQADTGSGRLSFELEHSNETAPKSSMTKNLEKALATKKFSKRSSLKRK